MSWRLKRSRLPDPLPKDFVFNKNLYAAQIKEVGRVQKYSEHILVMGRISTIWAEPEWYPTLRWNGEVMGLKDALRLKSIDSTELDVRATKTPKGDPPYLSVVQENLYPIRKPTVPTGSNEVKGSGSKIVLYGSEHLSVEDEGVNVEGGDEGDDEDNDEGAGVRPQVSLKRGRTTSSKSDPNPKQLKKKKLDFKTITLEDDEVDQITRFSTAGGLLENLDAHLHGGRTPRDRPVNLPSCPLSFGGHSTKVVDVAHMPEPLSFKKIEPSPSGMPITGVASNVSRPSPQPIDGGDSASSSPLWYETEAIFHCQELGSGEEVGIDTAKALEKYIPDWSLANKDRIVDALSAKMALFEREIASLKSEDSIRSKTKQEISTLRSQGDRLKEQVSEAKGVSKASQASVAAAYEARDKAIHDLEDMKLKFRELEKRLSNVEERSKAELREMQSSYDQLLADHRRLINDKAELDRAHDRAIESHQTAIDEVKGMLTRRDGEMVELYALVSKLMLTKQWFLTEGVAWVVKLVNQSPELEKVVIDLVNSVNAVGVNAGIKQGFKVTKDSAWSTEEVLGYDEGAKDTLDAAIKAFNNFHISILDKVSELVNELLSVIKQKSEFPIVKED
ncbi:hypothetical protein Hanom_Chr12g01131951 [Helianthus anomalus]